MGDSNSYNTAGTKGDLFTTGAGAMAPKDVTARYRRAATSLAGDSGEELELREMVVDRNALWTAISLVSGTAVGAGILAIPSVSLKPGFVPSFLTLCSAWALMAGTGFLIAEVACNIAMRDSTTSDFGLISITERLYGKHSAQVLGVLYMLFHYTLLIAYIAEAGGILSTVTGIPQMLGPILFTFIMGGIIAFGSAQLTDMLNNLLFILVLLSFLGLVSLGVGSVNGSNLRYQNYSEVGHAVPILLVALVFHNIVPTICANLKYHKPSIYIALLVGSAIPLMMFILWNLVILGIVPDYTTAAHSATLIDPLDVLLNCNTAHSKVVGQILVTIFSESAIITSFIGFVVGTMGYYTDIFPNRSKKDLLLYAIVLFPPMLVALGNPHIFLDALDAAGAYGISIIFGLVPIALALRLRADSRLEVSAIFTAASSEAQSYDELEAGELMNEDNELDNETERESEATTNTECTTGSSIELVQMKSIVGSIDNDSSKKSNKLTIDQRKSSPRNMERKQHVFSPVHSDDQSIAAEDQVYENDDYILDSVPSIVARSSPRSNNPKSFDRISPDSLHSPSQASRNNTSVIITSNNEYVFFVPGGDAVVFFMGMVFVAIILDKIIMG